MATRQIRRNWTGDKHLAAMVSTIHPQLGELHRGQIRINRIGWSWTDVDGYHDVVTGDYLDAEAALLDATAGLDEPVPAKELPEETS